MNLTQTRLKCLKAISDGEGNQMVRGYRFDSAAFLHQQGLIKGELQKPYWTWRLTTEGRWMLNLSDLVPGQ